MFGGTRFSGERLNTQIEADFLQQYAYNAGCLGVVVGDDIEDWQELSLRDLKVELTVDGSPVPSMPLERRREPLDVLVWLVNGLSQRGIGLEAGQVTILGAAAIATIGELARLEARITDP